MRLTRSCTSVAVKTISSPKPASTTHMLENSCKFPTISSADESLKKYIKLNKTQKACPNPYLEVMTKDEMGNFYFAESKEITKNSMQCYMSELGGALRPKALRFTKNGRFLLPKTIGLGECRQFLDYMLWERESEHDIQTTIHGSH
ncbi:unnamed protein product, partial [Mesorhabditis belari]|uniref:Uncharacterized protein n=1 Tax=Mesorhabditis belari TaxID=2138241 RepID=A0AAF3FQZ9_9BILA